MEKSTFDWQKLSIQVGFLLVPLMLLSLAPGVLPLSAFARDVVPGRGESHHLPGMGVAEGKPGQATGMNHRAADRPTGSGVPAVQSGPDLILESIAISKSEIQRGEIPYTRVSYLVKNIGNRTVNQEKIDISVLDRGKERDMNVSLQGPLAPGENAYGSFVVGDDEGWSYGSHRLVLKVDGQSQIAEVDENNNTSRPITFKVLRVTLPDLVVTDIQVTRQKIQHNSLDFSYVTYLVKNVGKDRLPPEREVVLRYWLDDSPITAFYPSIYGPLEPGESLPIRIAVGYGARYPVGQHTTQVEVDFGDHVRESNEQNNLSPRVKYEVVKEKE